MYPPYPPGQVPPDPSQYPGQSQQYPSGDASQGYSSQHPGQGHPGQGYPGQGYPADQQSQGYYQQQGYPSYQGGQSQQGYPSYQDGQSQQGYPSYQDPQSQQGYSPYGGGQAQGYYSPAQAPYAGSQYQPMPGQQVIPSPVKTAVNVMYAGAGLELLGIIIALASGSGNGASIFGALIGAGLWIWMALMIKAGKNWARITGTVFFGLDTVVAIAALAAGAGAAGVVGAILTWIAGLITVILIWRRESSQYFAGYGQPGYSQPGYGQQTQRWQ